MATTYTTNARLQKPATTDRNWDVPLNANADALDGMTALGSLTVTPTETPSGSLNVRVTAGNYVRADGTIGSFAGSTSFAVTASATTCLWLTDAGVLTAGASFPTTAYVRLAQAVAGSAAIIQVNDQRIQCATGGTGLGFVLKAGDTVNGPLTVALSGPGASVFSADPSLRVVGFFGAAPNTQAPSLAALTDSTTGTVGTTVAGAGTTYSAAVLNNNFASVVAQVNALTAALKRHGLMST